MHFKFVLHMHSYVYVLNLNNICFSCNDNALVTRYGCIDILISNPLDLLWLFFRLKRYFLPSSLIFVFTISLNLSFFKFLISFSLRCMLYFLRSSSICEIQSSFSGASFCALKTCLTSSESGLFRIVQKTSADVLQQQNVMVIYLILYKMPQWQW